MIIKSLGIFKKRKIELILAKKCCKIDKFYKNMQKLRKNRKTYKVIKLYKSFTLS